MSCSLVLVDTLPSSMSLSSLMGIQKVGREIELKVSVLLNCSRFSGGRCSGSWLSSDRDEDSPAPTGEGREGVTSPWSGSWLSSVRDEDSPAPKGEGREGVTSPWTGSWLSSVRDEDSSAPTGEGRGEATSLTSGARTEPPFLSRSAKYQRVRKKKMSKCQVARHKNLMMLYTLSRQLSSVHVKRNIFPPPIQ